MARGAAEKKPSSRRPNSSFNKVDAYAAANRKLALRSRAEIHVERILDSYHLGLLEADRRMNELGYNGF